MKLTNCFLFLTLLLNACDTQVEEKSLPINEESRIESVERNANYDNGTYCAEIEYYNPRTGTNSTYTLTVEIEDGRLVKIEWPNGGWLDESHYSGVEISESGDASFESDRGYQYSLHITDSNACSFDGNIESDDEDQDNSENDIDDENLEEDPE